MEAEIARMDEETKSCHRQFRQNKENKDSLKKHSVVLHSHLESVEKKLQQLAKKYEAENAQHDETLAHYSAIHKSYEEVYMQQASAQELMKWQLEVLQCKEAIKEGSQNITHLQQEINNLQTLIKDNEPPYPNARDFVVKIAEIKLSTMANSREIEQVILAIAAAEKEVVLLQENQEEILKKIEEKRIQEEERWKEENEKVQREKAQELARTKEQQQKAASGQSGVYKFGQFIHKASNEPPPSLMPKRGFQPQPPPSPRAPLMIPIPASQAACTTKTPVAGISYLSPATMYSVSQSPMNTTIVTPKKATSAPPAELAVPHPPRSKFLLNMPPRSPKQPHASHVRAPELPPVQQLPSVPRPALENSSKASLSVTLQQMSLQVMSETSRASQEPARTTTAAGPLQSCPTLTTLEKMASTSQGFSLHLGPGGDAQPHAETPISQPQVSQAQQYDSTAQLGAGAYDVDGSERMEPMEEFPSTAQESGGTATPKTPRTPESGLELQSLRDQLDSSKSPGFSYSFRSMFGDQEETAQVMTSGPDGGPDGGNSYSDNSFFASFFEMGGSNTGQSASVSPANMIGGGGFGPSKVQSQSPKASFQGGDGDGGGGAMAMFGDSSAQSPAQQQGSMGFSFSFTDSSASQDSSSGTGASSKPGFCLF